MPVFAYKAVSAGTSVINGVVTADTPRQARDMLRAKGFDIEEVVEHRRASALHWWRWRPTRRRSVHIVSFIRELATLLAVGIPLLEAIETLARQHKGSFAAALLILRDQVASGISLADAMRQQPAVFDDLCGDIAEVGESAGTLDASLAQLAAFEERRLQFQNRIGTALLYPALVLLTGIAVSLFLMTFVVPNLLNTLVAAGKPLPLATRIVKTASDFLVQYWWLILTCAGSLLFLLSLFVRTRPGQSLWHHLQLKLPILGDLIRKQALVRIAVVMATLLRSGIVFVRAVQIAQRSTRNSVLREALAKVQEAVSNGRDIAPALEATHVFPAVVVQVFAVGQQSGRLEEMLDRLASDYDRDVALAAQRLTAVLEPALILFLAVLVGLVAFATVLPILEASNVL